MNARTIRNGLASLCLTAILLTFASNRAQAQPTTLDFTLTGAYQLPNTVNSGDITTSTTKTVRWTSATLVGFLTNALGNTLPKGSYLSQDSGNVSITVDKAGDTTNVSAFVTFDTAGTQVFTGSANSTTGQQSSIYTIYAAATFEDGNGNSFQVDGLIRETVLISAQAKTTGAQTETITFSGSVAGTGTVLDDDGNADTAVFSGTISGSGKGPQGS
jgi:hypothetical protein